MDFLNIHIRTLLSEEFVGAAPTERATWLCLLGYCIVQENGGIIADCSDWSDRKWQQVVRVTKEETEAETELWEWIETGDGTRGLKVAFYPTEAETKVRAKRIAGRLGGQSTSQAKSEAARLNLGSAKQAAKQPPPTPPSEPPSTPPSRAPSTAPTEQEQEREQEQEGNESAARARASDANQRTSLPSSLDTEPMREAWQSWRVYWVQTFNAGKPMTEQTAHIHLQKLAKIGAANAPAAIENAIGKRLRLPAEPFQTGSRLPNGAAMR